MTIHSFCHAELLAHGPLSSDELTARAVAAGVTRARDPLQSVLSAVRHVELQLLDGRWVTPLWLLEGRCLTATELPWPLAWSTEPDADLGLLGPRARALRHEGAPALAHGEVLCVTVSDGEVCMTTVPTPDPGTLEVAALADRLAALTPRPRYGDERRTALRAVAQLLVDDPTTFRTLLPPLSAWVPALVEDARRRAEQEQSLLAWQDEQERHRRSEVMLDDCQAIEVALAAERAGVPVHVWVTDALDRAIDAARTRYDDHRGVVISLGDRWR
jgi:hypothetical protein